MKKAEVEAVVAVEEVEEVVEEVVEVVVEDDVAGTETGYEDMVREEGVIIIGIDGVEVFDIEVAIADNGGTDLRGFYSCFYPERGYYTEGEGTVMKIAEMGRLAGKRQDRILGQGRNFTTESTSDLCLDYVLLSD